ncbi:HOMOLOG OF MAMMALIAN LYST-INTERACTING PROTEIN 5-like [Olea europaea subsp. europaea]|uniref:HOMOLOG OF MAMMALIAN LYST-INTERACTING PROTEIN 5-like n=1 Tax=Olea europaea subsp. europaea TaxID=158383 RepID=A0A8S0UUG2_OLEEU|nr:HOMOLOG OF MAMMALIAN LYST-INTERACTING PROTEIN 5-like [Olea europaea subsp. europaea]
MNTRLTPKLRVEAIINRCPSPAGVSGDAMAAADNEPAKLLLPYLQRADELQKREPLVAYYCRLYAMERGLKIPQGERTKTTNAVLVSLMKQLEKDKKSLTLGPDDYLHLEGFALNVFAKADKQDRAGQADLNTAKTFYSASIFFEIINQFGELQPDLEQKQKYAAWKAADIRKAIKEGRKPVPGPPGGDKDLLVPSRTSSGEHDLDPSTNDLVVRSERGITDPATRAAPESDSFPQLYDKVNSRHSTSISSSPSNIPLSPPSNISPPPQYPPDDTYHQPPYPTDDTYHHQPSSNRAEHSPYSHHQYHPQLYHQEPQQHLPQQYNPHDVPPYSYPNFQSYPSFSESSLPTAPSHYPSYHQGSDTSYSNSSPSNTVNYPSATQYNSSGRNGGVSETLPAAAAAAATQSYQYDSSYQPPPEKIAEAHKAARFAVGALAFDDVSVAVDHLKKSLELLTNPSAGQ